MQEHEIKFRLGKFKKAAAIGIIMAVGCLSWFWGLKPDGKIAEDNGLPVMPSKKRASIGASLITSQPAMPKGFKPGSAAWRDPFAVPMEISEVKSNGEIPAKKPDLLLNSNDNGANDNMGKNNIKNLKPQPGSTENLPVLVGIISSGANKVAIIKVKEDSRTYKINDLVEDYELIQIGENSVILANSEINRELTLKR